MGILLSVNTNMKDLVHAIGVVWPCHRRSALSRLPVQPEFPHPIPLDGEAIVYRA